jgi:NAD(P)-dependent dehydrogenase (short-subunit alcohol dehydrogenase family)
VTTFNTDQRVLVTGASRGIGRAIAQLLAAEGATVIGAYRTGDSEAKELEQTAGIEMLQVDLADRGDVTRFLGEVSKKAPLHGLVNNAGTIDFSIWDDFTMEAWDEVIAVNLSAPVLLSHALRNSLSPGGAIVNIASTDGFTGSFASIAYSASKAALINVTKSLGNVFGPHMVRVNAIAPGWVDTGMSTEASYDAAGLTPLGRNGTPDDVARAVLFLLSDAAAYVTGATLVVDGGYTNVDSIMKKENDDLVSDTSKAP